PDDFRLRVRVPDGADEPHLRGGHRDGLRHGPRGVLVRQLAVHQGSGVHGRRCQFVSPERGRKATQSQIQEITRTTGSRERETGNGKQETGNRRRSRIPPLAASPFGGGRPTSEPCTIFANLSDFVSRKSAFSPLLGWKGELQMT